MAGPIWRYLEKQLALRAFLSIFFACPRLGAVCETSTILAHIVPFPLDKNANMLNAVFEAFRYIAESSAPKSPIKNLLIHYLTMYCIGLFLSHRREPSVCKQNSPATQHVSAQGVATSPPTITVVIQPNSHIASHPLQTLVDTLMFEERHFSCLTKSEMASLFIMLASFYQNIFWCTS